MSALVVWVIPTLLVGCGNIDVHEVADVPVSDVGVDTSPADTSKACGSDADCDTGLSCLTSTCNVTSGQCIAVQAADTCLISGVCFASGQEEPGDRCRLCDPALSSEGFVNKTCPDGGVCDAQTGICEAVVVTVMGEVCTDDADCSSGLCATNAADEGVCSIGCAPGSCPVPYACQTVTGLNGTAPMCVAPHVNLCRPCVADSDCQGEVGSESSACFDLASGAGAFCASACVSAGDCPSGYSCSLTTGNPSLCIPDSGECGCSVKATNDGASGTCGVGVCAGTQSCTTGSLSDCTGGGTSSTDVCDALGQVKPCAAAAYHRSSLLTTEDPI